MDESVAGPSAAWIARPLDHALLTQRAAGGDEPLLLLPWGLWFLLGVDQKISACRAAVIVGCVQLQGVFVQRRGFASAPSLSPILGQSRVVRRRPSSDRGMADDPGPGELGEVGARFRIPEPPPVLPGPVELTEVPGGNPVPRLVRMRVASPPPGEMPQLVVHPGENPGGDHAPVVAHPPPRGGVEAGGRGLLL